MNKVLSCFLILVFLFIAGCTKTTQQDPSGQTEVPSESEAEVNYLVRPGKTGIDGDTSPYLPQEFYSYLQSYVEKSVLLEENGIRISVPQRIADHHFMFGTVLIEGTDQEPISSYELNYDIVNSRMYDPLTRKDQAIDAFALWSVEKEEGGKSLSFPFNYRTTSAQKAVIKLTGSITFEGRTAQSVDLQFEIPFTSTVPVYQGSEALDYPKIEASQLSVWIEKNNDEQQAYPIIIKTADGKEFSFEIFNNTPSIIYGDAATARFSFEGEASAISIDGTEIGLRLE